jgi:hypothetical protein
METLSVCTLRKLVNSSFPAQEKTEWQETAPAVSGITPGGPMGLATRLSASSAPQQAAFDYPIGDYFLEIRRRLRENGKIGGENIKVTEVTDIPDGPLKGYQKTRTSLSAD